MGDDIKKTKKIFFIAGIITGVVLWAGIIFFFYIEGSSYCIEDGVCEEGISIKIDDDTEIIINEQTCLENYGDWYEDKKVCIF